jgi:hypothetical protein
MSFCSDNKPNVYSARESSLNGQMSTVDLLVLASSGQLLFILKMYFLLYKAYLNKEVISTEPSPSVGVPGLARLQTFSGG